MDACPDAIRIGGLKVACFIGATPRERRSRREVAIDVRLRGDFRRAARSDRLADAVDYAVIRERIVRAAAAGRRRLLEKLAQDVADVCLADKRIASVEVAVEKTGMFPDGSRVAVELRRARGDCHARGR